MISDYPKDLLLFPFIHFSTEQKSEKEANNFDTGDMIQSDLYTSYNKFNLTIMFLVMILSVMTMTMKQLCLILIYRKMQL